jgi:hypothetical protein
MDFMIRDETLILGLLKQKSYYCGKGPFLDGN